jgi:hypothetical protein
MQTFAGRFPRNLLPIGHDPGGNQICMSVAGSDRNTIYFCDHEDEADDDDVPGYDSVYFIVDSFQAFLGMLTQVAE